MQVTRRECLGLAGAAVAGAWCARWTPNARAEEAGGGAAPRRTGPRLGICDWSLGARKRAGMELAKQLGLEGLQVSAELKGGQLSFASPEEQQIYAEAVRQTGIPVISAALVFTNSFPLATDPRGPVWLEQVIDAAHALGCRNTLLACFEKGDLLDGKKLRQKETDILVARLKEAGPKAQAKGVRLGLESWLSAQDSLDLLERAGGSGLAVYYDIANSTLRGYDVPAEIRLLKDRICEFHFKDNKGLLGQGDVKIEPVCEAIREIGYQGWIVLEGYHGPDKLGYFRKNAATARKLLGLTP